MMTLKQIVVLNCLMCAFTWCYGQQTKEVSGIRFTYQVVGKELKCTLEAPTNGWIGVGFNHKNAIEGSDLLLFNGISGKFSSTDLFVKGAGNPVKDENNGGANHIRLENGVERDAYTRVDFSIPMDSKDRNDFVHKTNTSYWLILAYSVDDDFNHHSRVRKHIPFSIKATED